MSANDFVKFIHARHAIWEKRERGLPPPWTADPVLSQYRFCNVYRNLDKQTRLIHSRWLLPRREDPDVWFAMVVARLVNWWPSLEAVGYPVPWIALTFQQAMAQRKAAGDKVFTGAYMVRADATLTGSKADYLALHVLNPLWAARAGVRPREGDTLEAFHARLMTFRDMGSFMAAQVVADVKYAKGPLSVAPDWGVWAAPGPGSLRGLNRVLGREPDHPWKKGEWQTKFQLLQVVVAPKLLGLPRITGQDLQNCLCEFDKYERVRRGQGKPRSRYPPSQGA